MNTKAIKAAPKMPRCDQSRVVFGKDARLYKLTDIKSYGLDVPDAFTRCFRCKKPAVWLQTFYCDDWELANKIANDPANKEFVEQMREWAGSNMELSLCDEHKDSGEITQ
jgi:hypothetical protein